MDPPIATALRAVAVTLLFAGWRSAYNDAPIA